MLKRNQGATKKLLNWNTFWVALAVVYFTWMLVGFRQANAAPVNPEDWTVTENGMTVTLVSVKQYGVDIEPVWSNTLWNERTNSFGAYYFPTPNNGDKVEIGVRIDGMQDGINYQLFYDQAVTSADNGRVFYKEATPWASMGESQTCEMHDGEEDCWNTPLTNEYSLDATLRKANSWEDYPTLRMVFRPQSVGSSNIEITSVKQGDEDVVLNLTGRQTADLDAPHPINEYQLLHYDQPVTISYKLKNLVVGNQYSLGIGNGNYSSFTATDTVMTGSKTVTLDLIRKHVDIGVSFYGQGVSESNYVRMYFAVANPSFRPLGSLIIDDIQQGGRSLTGTPIGEGSPKTYSFEANDVEDVEIWLHAMDVSRDMDYYLTLNYSSQGSGGGYYPPETVKVSGEDLFMGAHVIVPAMYGEAENSPFTLSIYAGATDVAGYNSINVFYHDYVEGAYYGDTLRMTFVEDENIPRYTGSLNYTSPEAEAPGILEGMINAKYHNDNYPLMMRIEGQHYDPTQNYSVAGTIMKGEDNVRNYLFTATGAELNAGKDFVLEGLVLSLPEFNPDDSLSGYEEMYSFTVEINNLKQTGYFYYNYNGWVGTVMTYDGGNVAAMSEAGGIGGMGAYVTVGEAMVSRSSLDGSKHAMIHYIGEGFDPEESFGYRLFYNSTANNSWSETAGQMIENGVIPGSGLNAGELSVNVRVPEDGANGAMYTLVIEKNGGMVLLVRNYLTFYEEPMIESFKFTADDESFMQIGANTYRIARGVNATATLTGVGFDNAEQYKLWVYCGGYHEVENEYGQYGMYSRIPELSGAITLTGAQLNSGYVYALDYNDALAEMEYINMMFAVTDLDATDPFADPEGRGSVGEMSLLSTTGMKRYSGHSITLEYVPAEEVFDGSGYQIDENSGIIDVSDGGEPSEGPRLDNRTHNVASAEIEDGSLTVISQDPVTVIGVRNGVYSKVNAGAHRDEGGGTRTCWYDVIDYASVIVVLKGDGNMDGRISIADSNMINKSKVSPTLERIYRPLSDLEQIVLDLNNNGSVTIADSTIINKSLVSESLTAIYQPIAWD